jgi:alkylhydroperoxidase family enzyme
MPKGHEQRWQRMAAHVHNDAGELEPERRAWAHDPELAPEFAKTLVTKLQGKAAEIVDEDVRALADEGFSEDQIFEFLVSGSVHAGTRRLEAGLAALRGEG